MVVHNPKVYPFLPMHLERVMNLYFLDLLVDKATGKCLFFGAGSLIEQVVERSIWFCLFFFHHCINQMCNACLFPNKANICLFSFVFMMLII